MTVVVIVSAICALLLGLISIIIQSIIISGYGDCMYSQIGVGIWNGLLLLIAAISLLVLGSGKANVRTWTLIVCSMTLMASMVQVGVSSKAYYQYESLRYIKHDIDFPSIPEEGKKFAREIFAKTVTGLVNGEPGTKVLSKAADQLVPQFNNFVDRTGSVANRLLSGAAEHANRHVLVRLCASEQWRINDDYYGTTRKNLEIVLIVCGLLAILSKIVSLICIRFKHGEFTANVQYSKTTNNS